MRIMSSMRMEDDGFIRLELQGDEGKEPIAISGMGMATIFVILMYFEAV